MRPLKCQLSIQRRRTLGVSVCPIHIDHVYDHLWILSTQHKALRCCGYSAKTGTVAFPREDSLLTNRKSSPLESLFCSRVILHECFKVPARRDWSDEWRNRNVQTNAVHIHPFWDNRVMGQPSVHCWCCRAHVAEAWGRKHITHTGSGAKKKRFPPLPCHPKRKTLPTEKG